MTRTDPEALAFAQHDHGACAADALDYARGVCEQQGLRLTPRARTRAAAVAGVTQRIGRL